MARMQQNLPGGGGFDDHSILHDNDCVTYLCRNPQVMRNEYDTDIPSVAYRLHEGKNLALHGHIECRYRFVRNKNVGIEGKRASNTNPLSLSTGELMGIPAQYVGLHPDEADQFGCFPPGLGPFDSEVQQSFDDRVPNPKPGIERAIWILKNDLYSSPKRP